MKTKAKKLLSMLLSMILVLGMLPVTSFAAEGSEPLQADGVYQIGTADELIWFAGNADPASKAVLTADIDLAGKTWTPMAKLSGSFDGQGHTIKNLSGTQGLFTTVYGTSNTARAEVKNVTVEGTVSGTGMKIAGIAGSAYWANFTGVINRANVTSNAQYVSGIVGYSLQGSNGSYITLTNCANEGTITGTAANVAGLVAYGKGAMVLVDCYNSGDITGLTTSYSSGGTGGLIGYTQGYKDASSLTNCYNTGNVNGKTGYAGGIVGTMYNGVTATNCYNTGTITGGSGKVGAITGYAYNASTSKAVNCYYLEGSCAAAATGKPAAVDAGTTVKTADEMKAVEFIELLGEGYKKGEAYPALSWETVDIQSSTYQVTVPEAVGITFTGAEEASSDAVYKFSVAINDYYEITENFSVKINGETQEAASVEGHTYNFEYTASDDFVITVDGVVYTGVKLSQAAATLYPADTLTLTAEVDPNAEGTVVWASDNEAVATVADGVVTAKKAGSANITATIGDVSAICRITITHKPTLVYNGGSWGFGQSQIATVTLYDVTVKEHRWVGNTCLVTLDKETPMDAAVRFDKTGGPDLLINGTLLNSAHNTALLENGYAKLTLTAQTSAQNDSKTMIIWVEDAYEYVPVTGVEITTENLRVVANSSLQLTAQVLPENATVQDVTWSTTAPNTALSVQPSGVVQGSTMGHGEYYTITVASVENPTAKADCQVYLDWKPEDSITLNKNAATLNIGDTVKLSATVSGDQFVTNTKVTWSSSDEKVATVASGTVTAKKGGTATITATSYYGLEATCVVTVNACAHGETEISYGSLEGTETHKKITVCKLCEETIGEETEACVDEDSDGICDLCKGQGIVAATGITLDQTAAEIQKGNTLKLTATVTPADTTDKITWSTSDSSVATVNDGVVTAVGKGTATITAQCGSFSAECEVTVLLSGSKLTWWVYSEKATEITIKPGDTVDAVAGCTPKAESTVTFTSADPEIVTVNRAESTANQNGHANTSFTAKKAGETKVIAAYKTNPSVTAELVVKVVSDSPEQIEGYTVTIPADISIVAGETASIPVIVDNDDGSAYNAFDMLFTYDASKLELTSTEIDGMTVTDNNGTVRVVRYGEDLNVGSAAFTLTFKAIGTGEATVTAIEAKVDLAENALMLDAPDATILDDATVINISGYSVNLPNDFTGESTVAPGEDYTFEAKDKNYNYDVTAKIGDTEITVTDNGDGTFTISADQITGNIVITSTKEGKTFDVSLGEDMTHTSGTVKVEGVEKVQYMTDYKATLTKADGYTYNLKVTIGGKDYTDFTYDEATGVVTIPGADITGKVEFNSNKTKVQPSEYTVTFEGNGAGDAVGENTVAAGADYSFTLNKAEGHTYTVSYKMGDSTEATELTETDGKYTIEDVSGNLVITVEKESDLAVEIGAYVELDGKTVFLVRATGTLADGKAYAYNGDTMYYSNVYQAWSWLVIVEEGATFTADAAKAMITTVEVEYTTLDQTFDVNMTNKVDVNDAQLVYNIYNCDYSDFTAATMQKFLYADTNGDKIVDTTDVAAVINVVINGTN